MTFTIRKSLLFFFLFLSTVLNAQQRVVIAQANGDTLYIPIWQIDNISFENVKDVQLGECHIGKPAGTPTQVSAKDKIF